MEINFIREKPVKPPVKKVVIELEASEINLRVIRMTHHANRSSEHVANCALCKILIALEKELGG